VSRTEIIRLSLVRFATSFLVILLVGVLNRIMIAEFAISKVLVGVILSMQHLITPVALYFGFRSDEKPLRGRRRVPYIVIGMALCCLPMPFLPDTALGLTKSGSFTLFAITGIAALMMIGVGVALSSMALHALIVDRCPPDQRGEALTSVWIITLVGFIIAAPFYSWLLPTYDQDSMRMIFLGTAVAVFLLSLAAVWRQEKPLDVSDDRIKAAPERPADSRSFAGVFRALWSNSQARILFAFLALADFFFFMQEYVLEAYGQEVFKLSVAYTTSFNLYWGAGVLISMIALNSLYNLMPALSEKRMLAAGCAICSISFGLLAFSSLGALEAVILLAVFIMGFGKGVFNIGMARMMVRAARPDISGLVMALWAVVGGVAIGLGELGGGVIVDIGIRATASTPLGYGILFTLQSIGILLCLVLMAAINLRRFLEHLERRLPQRKTAVS
jgi:BCD family chlorophyll transporter-like MFS transporter